MHCSKKKRVTNCHNFFWWLTCTRLLVLCNRSSRVQVNHQKKLWQFVTPFFLPTCLLCLLRENFENSSSRFLLPCCIIENMNLKTYFETYHYRWFWDFWFGNCMGLKTSELGCFSFQIIISNHEISFKRFHKKFENWQKISLILLTES